MGETRTIKQIAANKLDMELFNLAHRIESEGKHLKIPEWEHVAAALRDERLSLRQEMHPADRKATS